MLKMPPDEGTGEIVPQNNVAVENQPAAANQQVSYYPFCKTPIIHAKCFSFKFCPSLKQWWHEYSCFGWSLR